MTLVSIRIQALILTALVVSAGVHAMAETPIDPLVRPDEMAGHYELSVGLSYMPNGEEGLLLTEHGPLIYTRAQHQLMVPIRLRYFLSTSSSILLSLHPGVFHSSQRESVSGERKKFAETEAAVSGSIGMRYRLAPGHTLDPAMAISLELPTRTTSLILAASWMRDPVVLSASLSHITKMDTGAQYAGLNLGTGLFLNDKIRFKASAQQSTRLDDIGLPHWAFSLGVVYALDARGNSDLYVGLQRTEHAGDTVTGLVLEWYRLFAGG